MTYLAIVSAANGKITKYAEFDTELEAINHVNQYGGFVFNNINDTPIQYINVDWASQTATGLSQAEIDAELAAKLDASKEREATAQVDQILGDIQRRALNVNFYLTNQLLALHGQNPITLNQYINLLNGPEGNSPITREQFINYIKSKL